MAIRNKHIVSPIDSRNVLSTWVLKHSTGILQQTSYWPPSISNLNLSVQRRNHNTDSKCQPCIHTVFVLCTLPSSLRIDALQICKHGLKKNHDAFFGLKENCIPIWSLHYTPEILLGPTGHIVRKSTANQSAYIPKELFQTLPWFWWMIKQLFRVLQLELLFSTVSLLI